jgi:hypothetical protein
MHSYHGGNGSALDFHFHSDARNRLLDFRVDPAAKDLEAWNGERVKALSIDYSQFDSACKK